MKNLKKLDCCRICKSENYQTVLKLNDTPLEDEFLKRKIPQDTYPLELAICNDCFYVFLPHVVSPDISYKNYIYESSVTIGLKNHYYNYAREIVESNNISSNSLAIDIGSNDGSMLRALEKQNLKVVGIEPAKNLSDYANKNKLKTINSFFNYELAKKIVQNEGKASLITANYMFANIDNLDDFLSGVKKLLDINGVFCIQTGYHPLQFSKNMFDYIYHEHFSYFTLSTLAFLLNIHNLQIIDASLICPKGGSLRVIIKHKEIDKLSISNEFKNLLSEEKNKYYNNPIFFESLEKRINKEKNKLLSKLKKLKEQNFKLAGIGASHSTTTLLYHFNISKYIDFIVDDNEKKHNTFSPGYHIEVFDKNRLNTEKIKYLIVLAWQHQETIIKKYKQFLPIDVIFIVPLPKFKVIKLT